MNQIKAALLKKTDEIYFAGSFYPVAEVRKFPHGFMVGIYDEKPHCDHIDFLNPESINEVVPCNSCQGNGCPTCGGFGKTVI